MQAVTTILLKGSFEPRRCCPQSRGIGMRRREFLGLVASAAAMGAGFCGGTEPSQLTKKP
jgi:hypothetical protein